jgi:hypothetical protein
MEKQITQFAAWLMKQVLKSAIENPEKRREIIALAREYNQQIEDFIDAVEIA